MSKENEETLIVYNEYGKKYLENDVMHYSKYKEKEDKKQNWLEDFLIDGFKKLPEYGSILEIGSGDGINAEFLKDIGYDVLASDASNVFLEYLKEQGIFGISFNILTDSIDGFFDGILAWRVFVHFTKTDLEEALKKIFNILQKDGRFIFNVLNSQSEEKVEGWVDFSNEYYLGAKRYFQCFDKAYIVNLLKDIGFRLVRFESTGGQHNDKWLCFVVEKLKSNA